eukprot:1181830-Prorocentrum_minimum.AAC.1
MLPNDHVGIVMLPNNRIGIVLLPNDRIGIAMLPNDRVGIVMLPNDRVGINNDWKRRTQILERLKTAVRRVVVQQRAQFRLKKVQELLNSAGRSKQKVKELCEEVFMGLKGETGDTAAALEIQLRMVRTPKTTGWNQNS